MTSSPGSTKQTARLIMLALVVWGIYLAVGSTGYFVQPALFDPRKSLIVLGCMALFLTMWVFVFRGNQAALNRRAAHGVEPQSATPSRSWSRSGLTSLGSGLAGAAVWVAAVLSWNSISMTTTATTVLGWSAALLILLSATFGLIALSDRRAARGKWLGLLGLLASAGAIVGFFVRMTP